MHVVGTAFWWSTGFESLSPRCERSLRVRGAHRPTLDELTDWTLAAEQVLTF
jgi:hypothetical protein